MGIATHRWRSHGAGQGFNPFNGTKSQLGKTPWNKGLTALVDSRISRKTSPNGPWQQGKTKQTDERIAKHAARVSETVKQKIADGSWHVSFSKRRTHEYKGVKLHGKWELAYAKYLDENNVKWSRPIEKFPYTLGEKTRNYTPDFYLPEQDLFIEIKGYETEKDRQKWLAFPHKLQILKGSQLKALGIIETFKDVSK